MDYTMSHTVPVLFMDSILARMAFISSLVVVELLTIGTEGQIRWLSFLGVPHTYLF